MTTADDWNVLQPIPPTRKSAPRMDTTQLLNCYEVAEANLLAAIANDATAAEVDQLKSVRAAAFDAWIMTAFAPVPEE